MNREERDNGVARGASAGSAGGVLAQAPLAMREPVDHVIHGDRRVDHYDWMRRKENPRVKEYLEAENAYSDATMRGTEGLQESLYQEMLGRIQQTDLSVPYLLRGYWYYTRTEKGKQYPIHCRERASGDSRSATRSGALVGEQENRQGHQILEIRYEEAKALAGTTEETLRTSAQASAPVAQEEEVLLDLNELAAGETYMGLGVFEVSDDNRWLVYGTDTTGYRQYVLEVKELGTAEERSPQEPKPNSRGAFLSDLKLKPHKKDQRRTFRAERVTSAAWAADNRTLFYVTEDEVTKRSNQLWRIEFEEEEEEEAQEGGVTLRVAQGQKAALQSGLRVDLIYEERDERFRMDVERSRSGAYLFLVVNSHTTSEVRYLRADAPRREFQLMAEREGEHEYYVDHHPGSAADPAGGAFFILTNSGGRTYRLMTAPAVDAVRSRWREVIPNRPGVMLAGMEAFRTHLVLTEREDGLPYLRVVDLTRETRTALEASRRIEFAEPAYNAMLGTNPEFETGHVRFHYESMVTPRSVYDYDVRTGERVLKKQQPVLGDFDVARYLTERLHARAKDGTMIPISLVRRKDTARDGNAALLLYGYGSYGLSMPVSFSSNRLSLLDRGMVYAIAHIRGGGELGKPWHDAGRMHRKMNTFTDFIACAEHLMEKRYTSAGRVAIEGGSAGGLLMGTVVNMRPDLFRVVVSHVPFVDVLNTMLDATLPLTIGEYEEGGNPQVQEDYFYMKQYCPYTNVERKVYPRMLVKTAWNDSQVMYWEAAKYVAKVRAMKTDGNVLLLKTNMGAGHGGASGRYDFLREIAFDYGFLLRELGIESGVQ